jgi:hypothetical protein
VGVFCQRSRVERGDTYTASDHPEHVSDGVHRPKLCNAGPGILKSRGTILKMTQLWVMHLRFVVVVLLLHIYIGPQPILPSFPSFQGLPRNLLSFGLYIFISSGGLSTSILANYSLHFSSLV